MATTRTNYDQEKLKHLPKQDTSFWKKTQNRLRKFGSFLAGMIMPLIGMIIGWGLFTAIVLATKTIIMETEGITAEQWGTGNMDATRLFYMPTIIGFGIHYMIPLFVGFFAGKQVLGIKGGVIGAIATLGVIGGANTGDKLFNPVMVAITGEKSLMDAGPTTMIMGAMIFAPLAAFTFKKLELLWTNRIKSGFEMLINNLSVGLFGLVCLFVGFWGMAPIMAFIQAIFYIIINGIYNNNLLPLLPIFVETEKVLFLNNAVNHGIFGPLGLNEVQGPAGKSVLFFMDPNPGQGMGLLLAYLLFSSKKEEKGQAASAIPIHFVGGIHEVYYPFILTKPINLIWMICGGIFATFMYQIFNVGGVFTPSPGSIIMNYLACNPKPLDYAGLSLAIFGAMAITFGLTSTYLIFERVKRGEKVYFNPKYAMIMHKYNVATNVKSLIEVDKFNKVKSVHYQNEPKIKTIKNKDGSETTKEISYFWEKNSYTDETHSMFVVPNKKLMVGFYYDEIQVLDKNKKPIKKKDGTYKTKKYLYRFYRVHNDINQFKEYVIGEDKSFKKYQKSDIKNDLFIGCMKKHGIEIVDNNDAIKVKKIRVRKNDKILEAVEYIELKDVKKTRTIEFKPIKNKKGKTIQPKPKKETYWQLLPEDKMSDLIAAEQKKAEELRIESSAANHLDDVAAKAKKIYFACEAGMGSSAMGAGLLRKYFNAEKIEGVKVSNCAIKDLPGDVDIVVTQESFNKLVNSVCPKAYVYTIKQFLNSSEYDKLIESLRKTNDKRKGN